MKTRPRPKHLNLIKVRWPITAIASILHRISGAFIFLLTPFLLYIFTSSLKDNSGYALAGQWLDSLFVKLCFLILIWSGVHHLLAGIRYLFLDFDIGVDKKGANLTAMLVTVFGLVLSLLTMKWLLA